MVFADVVQGADVRMRQLRDRARFAVEAFTELRVSPQGLGEDLDRDRAIQPRVARFLDLAHPARAEQRENLV